jgi:hypothetical protein
MTSSLPVWIAISAVLMTGCATVSMLPKSAAEVDFESREGKTGWSKYEHVETFKNRTPPQVYDAAKIGLGDAGFSLRAADLASGVVIGEHGMTAHDWNVIAGVYFKPVPQGTKVKVIVEGSKDIGFSGDVTSDGWTGKILKGLRQSLNETHQSILKVNRSDIE